jgi:hypothetical protein
MPMVAPISSPSSPSVGEGGGVGRLCDVGECGLRVGFGVESGTGAATGCDVSLCTGCEGGASTGARVGANVTLVELVLLVSLAGAPVGASVELVELLSLSGAPVGAKAE